MPKGEIHKDGYFKRQGSVAEVELLDDAFPRIASLHGRVTDTVCSAPEGFAINGAWKESRGRATFIMASGDSRAMVTYTDSARSGGEATFVERLLNSTVRSSSAILSLTVASPGTARVLWRLTWKESSNLYEFYIEDEFGKDGKGRFNKTTILQIAERVKCSSKQP
jgi:hypothetical protein